ncbi:BolA family transcriptional regulator [Endozoicomonas sp. OPT23]|uniref:BolA family protein n=1 Tax=Endozoicomonas sp. OPT23 TaxID=2072845 RepID=UPI00129AEF41|nr:BolA/IbaG family iron-sulfur metabolism protein [Endozoicomonas sp. OPT23]MRI34590.1 BolA family transcriptional regulator [Endozoicomonas sp. OPT23]
MSMQEKVSDKLTSEFSPLFIQVENESHMHNVPPNSETHFKVVLVSEAFQAKLPVKRHQMVYKLLSEEMQAGIHALALHTYTPTEWEQRQNNSPDSPNCMGGGK